ncbi:hypothetical protein B0H19DRAFT_118766 [Mycena capillaripes]|nr:hypothetical protein B0H19DRAFT_118766 [Mycena capillaripes]
MYVESPLEIKAELDAEAKLKNDERRAKPPPEHIAQNQDNVYQSVNQSLRALMGDGWGGHGRMAFYIRGAMQDSDGHIRRFRCSVGPDRTVTAFVSPHDSDVDPDFKSWAECVLNPKGGPPRFQIDEDGLLRLPEVDIDGLDADTLRNLIKGYSDEMNPDNSSLPVTVQVAGGMVRRDR